MPEKINDSGRTERLLNKLDESSKRSSLNSYKQVIYEKFNQKRCFYCEKHLQISKAQVDHFIPWAFIKEDDLWNFVLACPDCNRRKNNRLASPEYLQKIIIRNRDNVGDCILNSTSEYNEEKLNSIYRWAMFNGYSNDWHPKLKKDN